MTDEGEKEKAVAMYIHTWGGLSGLAKRTDLPKQVWYNLVCTEYLLQPSKRVARCGAAVRQHYFAPTS